MMLNSLRRWGLRHFEFQLIERIYPNGDDLEPNPKGIEFYINLVDELKVSY